MIFDKDSSTNLVIGATEENFKYFSSGVEGYALNFELDKNGDGVIGAALDANAGAKFVNNVTMVPEVGYATLAEAVDAANEGDVLEILADIDLAGTVDITKSITIQSHQDGMSGYKRYSITRKGAETMFTTSGNGVLSLHDIVINGKEIESANPVIAGKVKLLSVELDSVTTTGSLGLVNLTGESTIGGSYGISFKDCILSADSIDVFVGAPLTLENGGGSKGFSAFVSENGSITIDTTYGGGVVDLYFDPEKIPANIVKGSENLEAFVCKVEGYKLIAKDGNIEAIAIPYAAQINGVKYETLAEAWAAAVDGDVIELLNDATFGSLNVQAGDGFNPVYRNLTLKSATDTPVTLTREGWSTITIPSKGSSLTVENVIFDGNNESTNNILLSVESGGELTLKNVTFQNVVKTHTASNNYNGIVYVKNGTNNGAVIKVENVKFNDCTPDEYGDIYCDGTVSVKGNCEFRLYLDNTSVANDGLTAGKVTLLFPAAGADKALVTGNNSTEFIVSGVPGYGLVANNTDNTIGVEKMLVRNVTTNAYYATFQEAWTAAQGGEELELLDNVTVGKTAIQAYYKGVVTIKGNNYTITRTDGTNSMFLTSGSSDGINLENVTIDGANIQSTNPMLHVNNRGTIGLTNVKIVNGNYIGTNGIVTSTGYGSNLNINGLSFSNSATNNVEVYANCNLTVEGVCTFSAYYTPSTASNSMTDAGLADGSRITLRFNPSDYTESNVLVKGASNLAYYVCPDADYVFKIQTSDDESNLIVVEKPYAALVGDVKYDTFAQAWAAVKDGETIILHDNVSAGLTQLFDKKSVTITSAEGEKFTITRTDKIYSLFQISGEGVALT
ncbi:MAG: hypothetical protein K2G27_08395, partial [Duncaniella sp.]|nr:hypothetical protein [Duncaniella sp.]